MRSDDGPHNERPAHTVTLDAYSIDRYKVTLASIENFWKKGNLTRLRHGTMRPQRRSEIGRQLG
jgi:formylglycine-generating enzyme required for sulfatase activity